MKHYLSILFGLVVAVCIAWGTPGIAGDRPAGEAAAVAWTDIAEPVPSGIATPREVPAPMTARPTLLPDGTLVAQFCCKHCSSGKPCGDSCIARNKTCHSGRGCACATVDIY